MKSLFSFSKLPNQASRSGPLPCTRSGKGQGHLGVCGGGGGKISPALRKWRRDISKKKKEKPTLLC